MQKHISSFFGDHVDGGDDEIPGNARKNRCVNDPEVPYAMDAEFAVDHAPLIFRFHGAGAAGMVAPGVILDMTLQLLLSIKVPAGNLLFDNKGSYRIYHLAPELDPGDHRVEIRRRS